MARTNGPEQTNHKLPNNDLAFDSRTGPSVSALSPTLIGAAAGGGGTSGWYSSRVGQLPACINVQARVQLQKCPYCVCIHNYLCSCTLKGENNVSAAFVSITVNNDDLISVP